MGLDKILVSHVNTHCPTKNLYGDALEALIGALFVDRGFKRTKKLFINRVFRKYLDLETIVDTDTDYKSLVFEWTQKKKVNLTFEYKEEYDFKLKKSVFSATLLIDKKVYGTGLGPSKKEAEQEAAGKAWSLIKDLHKASQ
jgi:ribonuclease-3